METETQVDLDKVVDVIQSEGEKKSIPQTKVETYEPEEDFNGERKLIT